MKEKKAGKPDTTQRLSEHKGPFSGPRGARLAHSGGVGVCQPPHSGHRPGRAPVSSHHGFLEIQTTCTASVVLAPGTCR